MSQLPEVPLVGLTPPCGVVDRRGKRNRLHSYRPEHPVHEHRLPAWSRFPVCCVLASLPSFVPRRTRARRARCLSPTICSRLVVTCTLLGTPIPGSEALASSTTAPLSRFLQAGLPVLHASSLRRRGWPLLASPTLDGPWAGIPPTNPSQLTTLSGYPVSRVMPSPSLSLVQEPSESTGEHLLSSSFPGAGIPPPTPEDQDSLPCAQPRTPFHEPEMPSINESHFPSRAFARELPWAATRSWTSPSSPWLPTCFHAPSQEALDPPAVRCSRRPSGPPVARQSLQRSAPRALQRLPRFSMGLRRTAFPPNDASLSKDADRAYSGQGSQGFSSTSTPVSATARFDGFTPT